MESNLFRYVWQHSRSEQIAILLLVLASLPFYFLSLDLPKSIVNQAIQGRGFDSPDATQSVMTISLPEWAGGAEVFGGFDLERIPFLFALSFMFLILVCVNGLFKYKINTDKGRMGERMLRRLRFELFDRILRFPLPHFRKVKQAELATMIKDEVEPLGGFIGDAFAQPLFQGGMALTAMIFILAQSVSLGLVAVGIVAVQTALIPRLRHPIRMLGKRRQITSRHLAGRIAEVADGVVEIHANDTSNWERAEISSRLGEIFWIRFEIYQRKFFIKFLNNFLAQITPFLFYAVGGYFAIKGSLDVGQLVAVLVAYKDLPAPIKEIINWDQQRLDAQIKYGQVVEQFGPAGLLDSEVQDPETGTDTPLTGNIEASNATIIDETGSKLIEAITAELPLDAATAIIGDGSGKAQLGQAMAGLIAISQGTIKIGGTNVQRLPEAVRGRRISYVGPDPFFFPLTVRDNLLYALRHRPTGDSERQNDPAWKAEQAEALRTANSVADIQAPWVDYGEAGIDGVESASGRLIDILNIVGLSEDIYDLGLRGTFDPASDAAAADRVLTARAAVRGRLSDPNFSRLVETFDPRSYNNNASIAENLMFGVPVSEGAFSGGNLAANDHIHAFLESQSLGGELEGVGLQIATIMVELFADLPPGHAFFDQFSFIAAEELPDYQILAGKADRQGIETLSAEERARLLTLSFDYIEARHRLGLVDEELSARIVAARGAFREGLPENLADDISFYEPDAFTSAASLMDNILFGRVAYGQAQARERVAALIEEVLSEQHLRPLAMEIGLDYNVGAGGRLLSVAQRARLAVARGLLRNPDLLILNEALTTLDARSQEVMVQSVLAERTGKATVMVLTRPDLSLSFDKVLVLDGSRLRESGTVEELKENGGDFAALVEAA